MFGCLIIDKPIGITSHDIVSKLRKILQIRRIGHAGTLDPLATGVVVLGIGQATRLLNYLPLEPKVYEGKALLGISTDTYDKDGEVIFRKEVPLNYNQQLQKIVSSFTGKIQQRPPIYSAIKKNGKPLYKYARQGLEIEIDFREVQIYSLTIKNEQQNIISFKVSCSGGTYIRSLFHDIGELLGCGAHLIELNRTAVGEFSIDKAIKLDEITKNHILPIEGLLTNYKKRVLTEIEINKVKHGQNIKCLDEGDIQILIDDKGCLLALSRAEEDFLQPFCVINRD